MPLILHMFSNGAFGKLLATLSIFVGQETFLEPANVKQIKRPSKLMVSPKDEPLRA